MGIERRLGHGARERISRSGQGRVEQVACALLAQRDAGTIWYAVHRGKRDLPYVPAAIRAELLRREQARGGGS